VLRRPTRPSPQPTRVDAPNAVANQTDPLGIGVITRGLQNYWTGRQNQLHTDNTTGDVMGSSIHAQGPLPDPGWQGFYQSLQDQGVSGMRAGSSAKGSNQLRGFSSTPEATFDATYRGRPNVNYKSTMWDPSQSSAVTGGTFQQDQQYQQALKGLKGAR
jgi:hypothetical protein